MDKRNNGYVAILTVLVLLAVTGTIAISLTFSSTDALKAEESLRQGSQALLFSESCLEEAFLQIIRDPAYVGKTFEIPQGSCEVTVENNGGNYVVRATGKNARYERSVRAEAVLDPDRLRIVNWREE